MEILISLGTTILYLLTSNIKKGQILKILNILTGLETSIDETECEDSTMIQLEVRDLREKDLDILSEKFKIDLLDLEDVYDPEERPRVDEDVKNQYIELVVRYPLDFHAEEKSIPIICFIKPQSYCLIMHQNDQFITIKPKQSKKLKAENQKINGYMPIYSLMKFLTGFATQTEKIIKQFGEIRDDLEEQIFKSRETEGLKDIFHLSKSIVLFENNLKGNLIQLRKIMNHETLKIQENTEVKSKFDDLETDFEQYYDQIRIMREILNSSLDAYGGIVSNNVNEVMKTLTVFTILLSSPILIASIYGMNIELPFSSHPFAILFVVILSFILILIMILYMKRRNML